MKHQFDYRKEMMQGLRCLLMVFALLMLPQGSQATEYISDVMLIGSQEKSEITQLKEQYVNEGWTLVERDLNAGCGSGSDYIYLLYKSVKDDVYKHGYITDFYLLNKRASETPNQLTYNGRTYYLVPYVGGQHFVDVKGDLNSGTGSSTNDIHLYYTKDTFDDHRAVTNIYFNDQKTGAVCKEDTSTPYDLNKGCGSESDDIFMHLTTETTNNDENEFILGSLIYEINADGKSVTVTGHVDGDKASGELTIPSSVDNGGVTYSVTAIGNSAFYCCIYFTGDLTIPNSVTTIGEETFSGCSGFNGSLTIPNSVTTIGPHAFTSCSGLTGDLTIPNSVETIEMGVFVGCKGFTGSLTIPNSVKTIGSLAFFDCSGLSSLTIPNSVTTIRADAFDGCSKLEKVFVMRYDATSEKKLTEIGTNVFDNCTKLTTIYVLAAGLDDYKAADGWKDYKDKIKAMAFTVGSLNYEVNADWTSVTVTGHKDGDGATGALEIPESVDYGGVTYSVTAIGEGAFVQCTGLTSLTIPNSVTTIGKKAFEFCGGLTGDLIIPNSVKAIGASAFYQCPGFTSLTLGASVETIGGYAFEYCIGLTGDLTIPSSVETIEPGAFDGCANLTSVTIPNSVTTIGVNAFHGCSSLTSLTIPNSVITIEMCAFMSCSKLEKVYVMRYDATSEKKLTESGNGVFDNCNKLETIYVPTDGLNSYKADDGWKDYKDIIKAMPFTVGSLIYEVNADGKSVTVIGHKDGTAASGELKIPKSVSNEGKTYSVTAIGNYAFKGCKGLTGTLIIPQSVETIGDHAFGNCTGFGDLAFGSSVKTIGDYAFMGCSKIQGYLNIPYSVTAIGECAFNGCDRIWEYVYIPSSVETIGNNAFGGCSQLETVYVMRYDATSEKKLTEIGNNIFEGCNELKTIYVLATGLNDYKAAEGWKTYKDKIQAMAFTVGSLKYEVNADWLSVTVKGHVDGTAATGALEIPSSVVFGGVTYDVTAIGSRAFYQCTNLAGDLIIPNSVITIGKEAFYICSDFTGSLTIGNSVKTIGEGAFNGCYCFKGDLIIPNSVITIEKNAFNDCHSFSSLTIGTSVETIGEKAFYSCGGFKCDLTIPNSVTTIGSDAFYGCSGLTSLTIPNSVTTIGDRAFSRCKGFTSLTIPNSVTTIGNFAFSCCFGLTSLTIPNSVTTIGEGAFSECSSLTSVTIPNSVTTIGEGAFSICSKLKEVYVMRYDTTSEKKLTEIGRYVFDDCYDLETIYVLADAVDDYKADEGWKDYKDKIKAIEIGTFTVGSLKYEVNADGTSVTVTGHKDGDGATGALEIPESVDYGGVTYDVTAIGDNAFFGCIGLTGDLTIPNSVTTIGNNAFFDCSDLTGSLTIGNSVKTIGDNAFFGCIGLTGDLTIPNSVETIGAGAFRRCNGFKGNLTIGNSVKTIGNFAFSDCHGLTGDLIIPNSVTTIGDDAFYDCKNFTSLSIPNSVEAIGNNAFNGCWNIETVYVMRYDATSEKKLTEIGSYVFDYNLVTIYVLAAGLDDYKAAYGWNDYKDKIKAMPFTVGSLIYEVNADGKSVTVMGHKDGDKATGDLEIPESVTNDGKTYSVTAIGNEAFKGCVGLTSVTIPNSVETIGNYAFYSCSKLEKVYVMRYDATSEKKLTEIGTKVFDNCTKLETIYVPTDAVDDYKAADGWKEYKDKIQAIKVQTGTTVKVAAKSWATYFSGQAVSLGSGQQDCGLYTLSEVGYDAVKLSAISGAASKQTPLLIWNGSNEAKDIELDFVSEPASQTQYDSKFTGTLAATAINDITGGTVYVLYNNMFLRATTGTIPANRAYILVPGANAARQLTIDMATSIDNGKLTIDNEAGAIYDMQGRKVRTPDNGGKLPKGVYIQNGQKRVFK